LDKPGIGKKTITLFGIYNRSRDAPSN